MENTMIAEKQPLTEEYLQKMDAYWRAANYLAAAQLYLLDNPLLRRPLTLEDVKKKIVGQMCIRDRCWLSWESWRSPYFSWYSRTCLFPYIC